MPYAILRMTKCKGGGVSQVQGHHEREKEAYKSNPDIDPARSHLNYHFKEPEGRFTRFIQQRIEQEHCRVRSDSVKMVDTVLGASPEFMEGLPEPVQREYLEHAYRFMCAKIGEENIMTAIVHMDEKTPHLHLCFVPITRDGRLSAKQILGNKSTLSRWQDEYHAHMSARWPMLDRGAPAHETNRKHLPVQEYKIKEQARDVYKLQQENARLRRKLDHISYREIARLYEIEQREKERKEKAWTR